MHLFAMAGGEQGLRATVKLDELIMAGHIANSDIAATENTHLMAQFVVFVLSSTRHPGSTALNPH